MRILINLFSKKALLFCLLLVSMISEAQTQFTFTIANQTSTSNTFEFDILMTVPTGGRRIYGLSAGVNFNNAILNGGTPCTTNNCGSYSFVAGSAAPELTANGGLNTPSLAYTSASSHLRFIQSTKAASLVDLAAGTYRIGRFRFTNTTSWTASSNANLWLSPVGGTVTNTTVSQAALGGGTIVTLSTVTTPAVILTHTTTNRFSLPLNFPSCPTAAAASGLVAESPCAGAANGSAVITLTGAPDNSSAVTYTVDGGAVQNATLSAGAFTVSGLSAGAHVVAVTYPSCAPVSTSSFTIEAGAPLTTNGSVTTSICDGDTYVWPANGQSYTTAQSGTTFVSGCNTATLTLGINPATTTGSVTTSICQGQTYVWPANGQSYTTAQSGTTFVDGCNTATLNLTITPLTTNGDESVTACGTSYTWATSGQTYNASGVYPFVSGCNTATLTLTLNTSAQTFYADTDGDGFGAGAPILSCTGQPEGTSTNNTDCAPNDPLRWRTANFFVDADNDGYNNGFPATSVCYGATTPSGFVAVNNGVDCDEENASVNPNASEVLGNGIDDNCDGTVDEVTPLSSLVATSCGVTLTNLSNLLYAIPLTGVGTVQAYRFRVSNGANVRTFDSPVPTFSLSQLPGGVLFATTYTVEVSVKSNGFFRAYGPACTVTTQATPTSALITSPACGSTLGNMWSTIFCSQVPSASGYRFRVRNGATVVGTVDRTVNRFSLVELGINNIAFGTTYTVDVLLAFGGNLRPESEYGDACTITTPATPGTSRVIQPSCGSTINNRWTTIYAQQVLGAQGYKFVVTNGAQTREIERPVSNFALQQLPGGAAANTTYTIRVDVLYNSSYVVGTQLCNITTSPAMTRQASAAVDIYEVSAYPNPYAETFKLNVNTSSEDQVGVRVYDMLGREVEARQASVAAITNLEIGSQYPSGVYNIIVTQGDNVKTVRVVKR
ncbi:MAG: T9SS type A sorting domain-containing protein [Bacteroidota bacterium]